MKIVFWIFILTLVFVEGYNRNFFEYYLLYFFPWLSLLLGRSIDLLLNKRWGKHFVYPFVYLFIFLNIFTLFSSSFSYSYAEKKQAIMEHKLQVFTGPIKGQDGKIILEAGKTFGDKELLSMNFFIEGVQGTIPK